jgi:biotin carboxylase
MLKIMWTDRITNGEVYQRVKEERLLLKIVNNRRHSWIGHIIRHNDFVVNILERAISGKKGHEKTWTTILKASRQEQRSGQLYNNTKNSLQQIQMESCQPIKRLKKRRRRRRRAKF